MATMYYDCDADLKYLQGKKVAVIGYGNQGRAQALCLHDSGIDVVVGVNEGGKSWNCAKDAGIKTMSVEDAAKAGDIVHILIPDEVQPHVYAKYIKDNLKEGNVLSFSHGFNITFNQIKPPEYVDVVMVAPKTPGSELRRLYKEGFGAPALLAVEQDYTGKGKQTALAMAKAMNLTKAGVVETTFEEEAITDIFGEQCVLCGGITELITAGFETLVSEGYQPEIAYFECLNEMKLIVDLFYEGGLELMWERVSNTAEYGGRTRGPMIIDDSVRERMYEVLDNIKSGEFAREFMMENYTGRPVLTRARKEGSEKLIEDVGKDIRKMFLKPEKK